MILYFQGDRLINFDAVSHVFKQAENPWRITVVFNNGKDHVLQGEQAHAFWRSFAANARAAG